MSTNDASKPFDSEAHMTAVRANLKPILKEHWSVSRNHKKFMQAGRRRLLAKKDTEINDLRNRILHCSGACMDQRATFPELLEKERARDLATSGGEDL